MKLLFDSTTRRLAGSIEGSENGLPSNLIVVTGTLSGNTETDYLDTDNVTIITKPLSQTEIDEKNIGPDGNPIVVDPAIIAEELVVKKQQASLELDATAITSKSRIITDGIYILLKGLTGHKKTAWLSRYEAIETEHTTAKAKVASAVDEASVDLEKEKGNKKIKEA